MRRITISVEDGVLEAVRADVGAGRAPSISAWVGDAMRRKVLARAELLGELDDMAAERTYTAATVDWVAEVLGRPREWVADRLAGPLDEERRVG